MTSRRRRTRTTLTSVLVALALAVGAYALHTTGVLAPDAEAAPAATAPAATDAPTISTEPGTPGTSRASSPAAASPTAGSPTAASPTAAAAARAALAALPVKGKAPATGYDREGDFGTAWLDVDRNGCDTRNDVLARDLTGITRQGPCKVLTGTLVSPYTGATVDFVRGNTTSTLVQIDHVVALENAWRTGAQQLPQADREALANDPENLFAVDGHSNAQKRSGDAATWLPADSSFRCTYIEHQVTVKTKYRLWVAPAEHDAMARILSSC
ncbi:HNH endonuclease family protein [Curtobacterium sp. MCPF17_002]|uniref:HNH endonuclease family protein n=1 Tax=Curtobacterium sp. MCPF17_002 TaxID=2175645 RepID=UPI000DA88F11|nr:HNH endonuclease family protein [Curtobacterium sp. MCPF17_002]WIB78793.1 HNH endonuclease family protein [Curtobacterium sp. MCPF17_002]